MRLFDTRSQKLTELDLQQTVTIYVCGITPYDAAHVGHIFTFLCYDLLQRRLEDAGHTVHMSRNITDVDEPIFRKAAELGIDYRQLAADETEHLRQITDAMGFRPLYAEPKASEYIIEMAEAVKLLLDKGYAYRLEHDIYFDIAKYQKFGSFSGFSERLQLGFMTNRGGDPERPGKRQALDFLLWRGITDTKDPAAWQTVASYGRPGWHIECSIMSSKTLGTPLDIHGGGMDLIFPHHECEIAQSATLSQLQDTPPKVFANHWMHVAPILYQGEKMSKSLGNLVFARDLLAKHHPAVVRLALMQIHYRTGGEWRHDAIGCATESYSLIQRALQHPHQLAGDAYLQQIRQALDDDLDTHRVMHNVHDLCRETLSLKKTSGNTPYEGQTQLQTILSLLGLTN